MLNVSSLLFFVFCMQLFSSDLSNPTKPFAVYSEWTNRVMEEFYAQSSDEKARNISVTLPQKENPNLAAFQIGFIRFIRPFFEALNNIKDISMTVQLLNLKLNLDHWLEDRKKRGSGVSVGSNRSSGSPSPTNPDEKSGGGEQKKESNDVLSDQEEIE